MQIFKPLLCLLPETNSIDRFIMRQKAFLNVPFEGISLCETLVQEKITKKYVKHISALVASGGFLNEKLFCEIFDLEPSILDKLKKLGLLLHSDKKYFPHFSLVEMAEEEKVPLDIFKASIYWKMEILNSPFNSWACCSLILLLTQADNCTPFKHILEHCLEIINNGNYSGFLIDLAYIFEKMKWEDLSTKVFEYQNRCSPFNMLQRKKPGL